MVKDESENLLLSCEGYGGSSFFENLGFRCSKCFKFYFVPWFLKKHFNKCMGIWQDTGIKEINKNSSIIQLEFINRFGGLSKKSQGIDISMTHRESILNLEQTILIYVENGKPIGFITFCKRDFKNLKRVYSIDDFFVLEYMQRKGIGTKLLEAMLEKIGLNKGSPKEIEKNLVVCSPSNLMISFLKKKGYNLKIWGSSISS